MDDDDKSGRRKHFMLKDATKDPDAGGKRGKKGKKTASGARSKRQARQRHRETWGHFQELVRGCLEEDATEKTFRALRKYVEREADVLTLRFWYYPPFNDVARRATQLDWKGHGKYERRRVALELMCNSCTADGRADADADARIRRGAWHSLISPDYDACDACYAAYDLTKYAPFVQLAAGGARAADAADAADVARAETPKPPAEQPIEGAAAASEDAESCEGGRGTKK